MEILIPLTPIQVNQQAEERNVSDLKEQTSSLIQRIESMQSSIQVSVLPSTFKPIATVPQYKSAELP